MRLEWHSTGFDVRQNLMSDKLQLVVVRRPTKENFEQGGEELGKPAKRGETLSFHPLRGFWKSLSDTLMETDALLQLNNTGLQINPVINPPAQTEFWIPN
jgi:hypothetical protein